MEIELLYFERWPNCQLASARLGETLRLYPSGEGGDQSRIVSQIQVVLADAA